VESQILKTVNTKITIIWSQDSSVGISTGCGPDGRIIECKKSPMLQQYSATNKQKEIGFEEFRIFLEGETSPGRSTAITPDEVEILATVYKCIKNRETRMIFCRYKRFPFARQYSILQLLYCMFR
jgi:hypothetical protein